MANKDIRNYLDKYGKRLVSEATKRVRSSGLTSACAPIYDGVAFQFGVDREVAVETVDNYFQKTTGYKLGRLLIGITQGKSCLDEMDERGILTSDEREELRRLNGEPARGYGAPAASSGRPNTGSGKGKRVVKSYKHPTI